MIKDYDFTLALMTGVDIPLALSEQCNLILHQPTIKEISLVGEKTYFTGVQCLCLNKSMYGDEIPIQISNFELFMQLINDKRMVDKKSAVKSALTLLFPSYQILMTPRTILFKMGEENFIIDEGNFESLQFFLQKICCLASAGQDNFNPANAQAKAIADKLMKARQRVAAQKQAENGNSVFTTYISVLTVGLGSMSLQNVIELTMYQLYDLVERYMLYVNWDMDIKSRLAGAKGDKPVDNWMKPIHQG